MDNPIDFSDSIGYNADSRDEQRDRGDREMTAHTESYNGSEITIRQADERLSRFNYKIGDEITVTSIKKDGKVTGAVVITTNFDSFGLGSRGVGHIWIEVELENGTETRVESRDITHKVLANGMSLSDAIAKYGWATSRTRY